ncbi:mitochondrial deoxynucleotide carrier [Sphaerosporella brunnea]|uniref:Mitochondrial thiamine pyrophosphate carrier 1 n=1 Tax=Sphaerosporella brunnea TaxID=1250544 RepID=A0A5J5F0T3_9PEZI|nr:mitochondrial deoxynucleotide carrier [Sphaerosporella brunnea]
MPKSNEKINAPKSHVFLSGAIAGLFSRLVIAPLDVVKIRLQLQPHGTGTLKDAVVDGPTYRGIIHTMRTILRQEGIRGLWKGNIPAVLLYMTYSPVQFITLKECTLLMQRAAPQIPETPRNLVAGGVAGAAATAATYPLDLLRTRFAAQGSEKVYTSILHAIHHIYAHEGVKGYYRGLDAAIGQIVPYMSIFFCCYEATRSLAIDEFHMPEQSANLLSGGFASTIGKTVVFPFDLVRKRLQVQGPTRQKYVHRNIPAYANMIGAMRDIIKYEGYRGLYKGFTVSLIKAAPLSAVTMWTMEGSLKIMDWIDPRDKGSE